MRTKWICGLTLIACTLVASAAGASVPSRDAAHEASVPADRADSVLMARAGGARGGAVAVRGGAAVGHRGVAVGHRGVAVGAGGVAAGRHTTVVRRGAAHGTVAVRRWVRRPYYGRVVAGVTLGTIIAVGAVGMAPAAPDPGLCWYWANSEGTRGYWDYCQ